jgi:small GTP-binding protein
MMTIGINYVFKVVNIQGVRIKLQIWDTAGQDKYKTITKNYYRNSQGVLVVFAIDDRESFRSVSTPPATQPTGSKISPNPPRPTSSSS